MNLFKALETRSEFGNQLFTESQNITGNVSLEGENMTIDCNEICQSFAILINLLRIYYVPLIVVLGLVGNSLSCCVFLSTRLKMRSSSYYLAALACADCGFLVPLLLFWLNTTMEIRVLTTDSLCQSTVYVTAVSSSLSVWLIVAFTVERFLAVQYPLHLTSMCTVRRAKMAVAILTILAMLGNSYYMWTSKIVRLPDGSETCGMRESYMKIMEVISLIDSFFSTILPMVLIILLNTMIIHNLLYSHFYPQTTFVSKTGHLNSKSRDIGFCDVTVRNKNNRDNGVTRSSVIHDSTQPSRLSGNCISTDSSTTIVQVSSRNQQQGITKMLLLISSVFVLLNLPSLVMNLHGLFLFLTRKKYLSMHLMNLHKFSMLLFYTNHSINFLLYAVCGSMFRQCLKQMKCKVVNSITNLCRCKDLNR